VYPLNQDQPFRMELEWTPLTRMDPTKMIHGP